MSDYYEQLRKELEERGYAINHLTHGEMLAFLRKYDELKKESSRSRGEAARYAAQVRWAGRGKTSDSATGKVSEKRWADLKEPDGGFTINQKSGEQPIEGFAVAIRGRSQITPAKDFFSGPKGQEVGRKKLKEFLVANADLFDDPDVHIGAWHDPKNGEVVLDPVRVVKDRRKAIRMGRDGNQQSIADLKAIAANDWDNAFIDTGGTGDRDTGGAIPD